MATTWIRMKLHFLGSIRLSRLLTPVVLLSVIYFIYRWQRGSSLGLVTFGSSSAQHDMLENEIKEYLNAMEDTRPEQCMSEYYHQVKLRKPQVSILMDFHDRELYNLKLTLTSIVENTPSDLYTEIIVLDDGTSDIEVRRHAANFIKQPKFKNVLAYRSEDFHGQAITRFKASQVAQGDILVFVSSSSVVNIGWLEPLLDAVLDFQDRIVVPHADNFLSDKRFFKTDNNLVSVFTWPLSMVYMESTDTNPTLITSPVMRGDVLAVTKNFLQGIGNYDEGIREGGGQNLELSLRTWLCGGEIKVAVCSRIATHSAFKPVEISNPSNSRRIANLWIPDYKEVSFKQARVDSALSEEEKGSLQLRRTSLRQRMQECKHFSWYLSNILPEAEIPSDDMVYYGKLKSMMSYCIRSTEDSWVLDIVQCRPYMYEASLIFELDKNGKIKKGDRCFTAGSGGDVNLSACQDKGEKQHWSLGKDGFLQSSFTQTCLTHQTNQEPPRGHVRIHKLMTSECGSEKDSRRQTWAFISY